MKKRNTYMALFFLATLFLASCSKNSSEDLEVKVGALSDCMQSGGSLQVLSKQTSTSYRWMEDNRMEIKRNNVPVACKSAEIKVNAKVENGCIIVDESPLKDTDTCLCVRNFRYEIEEIPSGDYNFVLNGNNYGLIRIY